MTLVQLASRSLDYLVVTFLLAVTLNAQTGNVAGTVMDSSKRVLVGAQVQVEGMSQNTATDDSGRYKILGLPVGTAKVTVSYLGLASSTQGVTVVQGSTAALDFALIPSNLTSEVTVSTNPDVVSQQRALNDQKNSINFVNIVA